MSGKTKIGSLDLLEKRIDEVLAKSEEAEKEIRAALKWVIVLGFAMIVVGAIIDGWQGALFLTIVNSLIVWPIRKLWNLRKEIVALRILPRLALLGEKEDYSKILKVIIKILS